MVETVTLIDSEKTENDVGEIVTENRGDVDTVDIHGEPPLQLDQEWANALTHAIATIGAAVVGVYLVMAATAQGTGLTIACGAYVASVIGTFFFSTMSHVVRRQPLLNTMRAWDQAMIYTMISGTYTPIVYRFATDEHRTLLLAAIWIAAGAGFLFKVAFRHRINATGAISYLLLGWLPSLPLVGHIPSALVSLMVAGGILYTVGVVFLMNDSKVKYMHAAWHLSVVTAATLHYLGILDHVVNTN